MFCDCYAVRDSTVLDAEEGGGGVYWGGLDNFFFFPFLSHKQKGVLVIIALKVNIRNVSSEIILILNVIFLQKGFSDNLQNVSELAA